MHLRPYQIPIFNDNTTGILGLHWARQLGKSTVLAAWAVDRLLTRPGRLVTVLSNCQQNGAEFAEKCQAICAEHGAIFEAESRSVELDLLATEIRIKVAGRKGRIRVLAANPRTARDRNRSSANFGGTQKGEVGQRSMATRRSRGFTMIEVLVVVVMIAILAAVVLPALSKANEKAKRIHCVGHLKNVGLAHRIFATDNGELFPWERARADATNRMNFPNLSGLSEADQVVRIYQSLSNELSTPKIIVCPADVREAARDWGTLTTNHISYFVGLSARESLPQTLMAGDRNLVLDGKRLTGKVELKGGAGVAWDESMHRFQGAVTMGDGSVQQLRSRSGLSGGRLKEALENTGVERNVLLIP